MSIKVDLKIFLFVILFWLTKQIEIYAILMIFALLHEIGHLVCGLVLGAKPISIVVNPLGFKIYFNSYIEDYNQKRKKGNTLCVKRMLIALAGPIFNLIIAFVCLFISLEIFSKIEIIIYANLILAIFNLIPVYPLDGGRILKEILHIQKGKELAYEWINKISKITVITLTIITSIIILYIHNIAFVFIIAYLWFLVIRNEKKYTLRKNIYKEIQKSRQLEKDRWSIEKTFT